MDYIEKEYVYVDKRIVPHLEILQDILKLRCDDIDKIVKGIINDTEALDENLEDNFLQFKLHAKKVRECYKAAVDEQLEKSEKLWTECDELISKSKPTVEKVSSAVRELETTISKCNKILNELPIYKVEQTLNLIEKFKNMSNEEKTLLSKLFKE